jgi:adenylate cyclase
MRSIHARSDERRGCHLRLLPNVRYGTERYPENVARRLRLLNIATCIGFAVATFFAITQMLGPTPGLHEVAAINALAAVVMLSIPLLHRVGPRAAPLAFVISAYAAAFVVCVLLGIGTGMQFIYLVIAALVILLLGPDHVGLSAALYAVAAILVIVLEVFVPRDTGLQAAAMTFASFIITALASCAILFTLVLYGVREAELEHA